MTTAKRKPNGAGRPALHEGKPMKSRTYRLTDEQSNKLDRLGGAAWLRKKIDTAKDPAER